MEPSRDALFGVWQRIFAVSLQPVVAASSSSTSSSTAQPPPVYLQDLAKELEATPPATSTSLDLDRVIVARLFECPPASYPQTPLHYLLGCYARACNEQRSRPAQESPQILTIAATCRKLIVSYSMLCLQGVVSQSSEAEARGPLQLLDSLDARAASSSMLQSPAAASPVPGVEPMPPGFMEDFASRYETDGLDAVLTPIVKELARRARSTSPLGDYATPLSILSQFCKCEAMARVLTRIREWLPDLKDVTGRGIELPGSSWLGPCFSVSPLSDDSIPSQPSVLQQCFSGVEERRASDVAQSISALRMASRQIQGELHHMVKTLLGNQHFQDTREAMISWLGAVIEGNAERGKMVMDAQRAASHGFFINLNAVLLKLCGPFMDPANPNFWKRMDSRFVALNTRLSYASDTKLGMTAEEEAAWRERVASSLATSSSTGGPAPKYHFICDCFFLTAKALHLGVAKLINERMHRARYQLQPLQQDYQQMEQELVTVAGTRREAEIRLLLLRYKDVLNKEKAFQYSSDCVLGDPDLMREVLAFYRLMATWMLCTACPQCKDGNLSHIQLPLPTPPPPEFAGLPEHFVEDMADVLLYVSRASPALLSSVRLDEVMLFLVVFMGSPSYVKSSHLRSKLSEVLHVWLPQEEEGMGGGRPMSARRVDPRSQLGAQVQHLFQGHPMVISQLVPTLLRLFVDVEFTDQHNAFYLKFSLRQAMAEVLHYLWNLPVHRDVWKAFAIKEGSGSGDYVRFCNMLISDSIFLLDDSLKKLQDIKEKETKMTDPGTWLALSPQEQEETRRAHSQTGDQLRTMLTFAQGAIHLMSWTTQEITAPFLLPEMVDRLAGMLDYFLKYLTGSERRRLVIKEPEKYNFKPKELLMSIIQVYLHMSRADRSGALVRAIAADERSYTPQMFPEAQKVLLSSGLLDPVQQSQLDTLGRQVEEALSSAKEQDDLLADADIPNEFLDPLMATIMDDPVLLPTSSRLVMDRAHIVRHLLSDQRDPSTREPLTPDMLIPQPELQQRIRGWLAETMARKRAERRQPMEQI